MIAGIYADSQVKGNSAVECILPCGQVREGDAGKQPPDAHIHTFGREDHVTIWRGEPKKMA